MQDRTHARALAFVRRWTREEAGQDLLEYSLLASLIALFAVGAIKTVGETIIDVFWWPIANIF